MLQELHRKEAKHGRLFELLRQKNQAENTIAQVDWESTRTISENEMLELQHSAFRSLQAQG